MKFTCHRMSFNEFFFEPELKQYLFIRVPYPRVRFWGPRCEKEICNPDPCTNTLSYGLQSKTMSESRQKWNMTRLNNDYVCKPYSQEQRSKHKQFACRHV